LIDPPALRAFVKRLAAADLRLTLKLCLPAMFAAIVVRAVLFAYMPAAFVHNDTGAILETADRLVSRGAFVLDGKKTFLAPLLYSVPAVLNIPILPFVAVVQHLLGILLVLVCGLLTRAWLRHWRILIVPVTLAVALNPVMLWYEHTALAETLAIFGIASVALTATIFWRAPNRYTLGTLFCALLFMTGARPEGRLFALFALLLVARTLWGNWRTFRIGVAATAAWTIVLFAISKTSQSGLLLFTSVLQLAPPQLVSAPGIGEEVRPLAEQARAAWRQSEPPKLVALRKQLQRSLIEAQVTKGVPERTASARVDSIAKRAGIETALRNPAALPGLALEKFVIAHRELPCGDFSTYPIEGQMDALLNGSEGGSLADAKLLWRQPIESPGAAREYLEKTYCPLPGDLLTGWLNGWQSFSLLPIAPIDLPGSAADRVTIHGLPWLYAAALAGLLCLAFRDPRPLNFHQLWGAFLICLFILIMVTANIRARFRVIFEPMWILYAFALLDSCLIVAARFWPQRRLSL
jgi:hypothetical protein